MIRRRGRSLYLDVYIYIYIGLWLGKRKEGQKEMVMLVSVQTSTSCLHRCHEDAEVRNLTTEKAVAEPDDWPR